MSTWEERMSAQSHAKGRSYLQERELARQAEQSEFDRQHAGHHTHLIGSMVQCSCGEDFGVTCVAFPPEWANMSADQIRAAIDALSCSACGRTGLIYLGP